MSKTYDLHWLNNMKWLGIWALLIAFYWLIAPGSLYAAKADKCNAGDRVLYVTIQPWDAYLPCREGVGVYFDSLQGVTGLLFWLIDTLLKLAGYIAVGFVIWGSIKYIKAQGEPGELSKAKTTIINALVGLAICIASVAIVNTVAQIY
ncbi:MAG TPA: hypothetical protein VFZ58_03170 [Candidatus Saccharimonadales bacterium]